MKITVAICTWNRSKLLDQTLDRMTKLIIPPGVEWELLVVNNNCTDNTDEIIEKYTTKLPIRRCFEPIAGQSSARNRAVKEAKGDYIIWTDDDVLAGENWIEEYCKAFRQWPDTVIFGGPIEALFEEEPPAWLKEGFDVIKNCYAILDFAQKNITFNHDITPFGANYAIRTKEQIRYAYDPALGNTKDKPYALDETDVIQKMLKDGYKGRWVCDARVKHFIPKERFTLDFVRRITYARALAAGRYFDVRTKMLFGRPRYLWRVLSESGIKYVFYRIFAKPKVWIQYFVRFYSALGLLSRRHR